MLLKRLWHHFTPRRRLQARLLILLMFIASVAEVISIGSLLPFLGVLIQPERVFEFSFIKSFVLFLGINTPEQLLLPISALFCATVVIAGFFRLMLSWVSTRLTFSMGSDISLNIYRKTLYQPYTFHLEKNSSEVISSIVTKSSAVIYSIVGPVLMVFSSTLTLFSILLILILIDPVISLIAFLGFGFIYILILLVSRKQKVKNSLTIARESTRILKVLQEGLGSIRDILLEGSQPHYCLAFKSSDVPLQTAQASNTFLAQAPRYAIEPLAMILMVGLAYYMIQEQGNIVLVIPVLGTLAIAAQRILPLMQQAYAAWSSIIGGQETLRDILDFLDQELPKYLFEPTPKPIQFSNTLVFKNLSFRYGPQNAWIIKNLNFSVPKGGRIGVVGPTGSGKSTLLDILMGLLEPTEGVLEVDGQAITVSNQRAWQSKIAHVPQNIYLSDTSIEENIALSIDKNDIDHQLVIYAAKQAQIYDFIENLPEKYETIVGERGVRLSGGQRQRIGIARALYKKASVIIFDEATSALDSKTEKEIMSSIDGLSQELTILIIAHRLTTIKSCTDIIEITDGGNLQYRNYEDIVAKYLG